MPASLRRNMTNNPDDSPLDHTGQYRDWPHDLPALQTIGQQIHEEWKKQNPNSPRPYPTTRWLTENGYASLRRILKTKHSIGVPEFFTLFTAAEESEGYDWIIDDKETITRANEFIKDRVECRGWAASTARTTRSRVNTTLGNFSRRYGTDAIIQLANNPAVETRVYTTFKEVGKELREDLTSHESAYRYLRDTHRFFEWLERASRIAYDPMAQLEGEFRWDWSRDPDPLQQGQVKRLWVAAETKGEYVLVIGYCVWGLRTKELPLIHIDQIDFDAEDPIVRFDNRDRKNGAGEVTLLFGLDKLAGLLDLRTRISGWNGCLYPSNKAERKALSEKRMRQRFKGLCRRANVTINGEFASPKHGRAFYYNILSDAETAVLEMAERLAQEQGSMDAEAVRDYYLTDERRRQFRRRFFRQRLRKILPDDAYVSPGAVDYNSQLTDYTDGGGGDA